jgi:hypothetical protein
MSIVGELVVDTFDEEVLEHVKDVDDVAETIDAVRDARATAADGSLGFVHTVTFDNADDYDYR